MCSAARHRSRRLRRRHGGARGTRTGGIRVRRRRKGQDTEVRRPLQGRRVLGAGARGGEGGRWQDRHREQGRRRRHRTVHQHRLHRRRPPPVGGRRRRAEPRGRRGAAGRARGGTQEPRPSRRKAATAAARPPKKVKGEPLAGSQWDMQQIHATADGSYRVEPGDHRVLVGVIDTGIDGTHPDIAPNFDRALSRNFTTDIPVDANGTEVDGPCEHPSCVDPVDEDDNEHGTHVASTIASPINELGIAGVAPGVRLVNIRAGQDSGLLLPAAGRRRPHVRGRRRHRRREHELLHRPVAVQLPGQPGRLGRVPGRAAYGHQGVGAGARLRPPAWRDASSRRRATARRTTPRPSTTPPARTTRRRPVRRRTTGPSRRAASPSRARARTSSPSRRPASAPASPTTPTTATGTSPWPPRAATATTPPTRRPTSPRPSSRRTRSRWPRPAASSTPTARRTSRTSSATARARPARYYQYLQGTSMASPHATGVVALIVSRYGHRDPVHGGLTLEPGHRPGGPGGHGDAHALPDAARVHLHAPGEAGRRHVLDRRPPRTPVRARRPQRLLRPRHHRRPARCRALIEARSRTGLVRGPAPASSLGCSHAVPRHVRLHGQHLPLADGRAHLPPPRRGRRARRRGGQLRHRRAGTPATRPTSVRSRRCAAPGTPRRTRRGCSRRPGSTATT